MTTSDKIALLSAIATLGSTLIAVFALWKQMALLNRQLATQNKQLQMQQFTEYTKRYQEIIFKFPENINEPSFALKDHPNYDQVMRSMRNYFDLCFEEWLLHKRGFLDEPTWEQWRGGMKVALSKPAFSNALDIIYRHTLHGEEFESFLRNLQAS